MKQKTKPHGSLSDYAYEYLKNAIMLGEYPPGLEITELGVSEQLNISRTPIKSALYRLSADGLVDIIRNKGYYVHKYDLKDIIDITQAREALEGIAAYYACTKMQKDDYAYLASLFPEPYEFNTDNQELHFENGQKLHTFIIERANNAVIAQLLERFAVQISKLSMMAVNVPGRNKDAYSEHVEIIKALLSNDPEAAEKGMRLHIKNIRIALIVTLAS